MKKFRALLVVLALITWSCEKENEVDKTPPAVASGIAVSTMNSSVKITWTNPGDEDFAKIKIVYGNNTIEATKEETEKIITDLENGSEYTFSFITVDKLGNESEPVIIKAKPDKYVTKTNAIPVTSGTYSRIKPIFPVTITINNSQYKRIMEAGGTQFIWEGTWGIENDTTCKFNYIYHTIDIRGDKHVATMDEKNNIAISYVHADSTIYSETVFEKKEGSSDFLPGKYSYYLKTVSSDAPSYNKSTYNYVTISEDGKVTYSDSNGGTESSTWSNSDLLNGRFIFVKGNSKTYLIIRDRTVRYYKK